MNFNSHTIAIQAQQSLLKISQEQLSKDLQQLSKTRNKREIETIRDRALKRLSSERERMQALLSSTRSPLMQHSYALKTLDSHIAELEKAYAKSIKAADQSSYSDKDNNPSPAAIAGHTFGGFSEPVKKIFQRDELIKQIKGIHAKSLERLVAAKNRTDLNATYSDVSQALKDKETELLEMIGDSLELISLHKPLIAERYQTLKAKYEERSMQLASLESDYDSIIQNS